MLTSFVMLTGLDGGISFFFFLSRFEDDEMW